jgi:hypothetical protein
MVVRPPPPPLLSSPPHLSVLGHNIRVAQILDLALVCVDKDEGERSGEGGIHREREW